MHGPVERVYFLEALDLPFQEGFCGEKAEICSPTVTGNRVLLGSEAGIEEGAPVPAPSSGYFAKGVEEEKNRASL